MPTGLYISVPFCKTKCSYCNFASGVFSRNIFQRYVEKISADIHTARGTAEQVGGYLDDQIDSIYLGGGTPTLLDIAALEQVFVTISQNFHVSRDAEITIECAPGTLSDSMIDGLMRIGVNRVSLGVQSFVDEETRSVGRLHTRAGALSDIVRLQKAGITNINVDLIAGLPHQNAGSWAMSLEEAIDSGVPHISIYMLEVDQDSRLGRELIAGGSRYHAHFVPDEELTADLYVAACESLTGSGINQYEISNFARTGKESQHNLKYWLRRPYMGFGVDAHSMLLSVHSGQRGVRFNHADSLERFLQGEPPEAQPVAEDAFLQEAFFLGLRLNKGISLHELEREFEEARVGEYSSAVVELTALGLLAEEGRRIFLTPRGRLLSNEVFQRFIASPAPLQHS